MSDEGSVVHTPRLRVRKLTIDDAAFIVELLNDPSFLQNIGDRHVRTLDDARRYIETVPLVSYERYGFGHYLVEVKTTRQPVGICSLVKRDWLEDVDLGFAFLPEFRRHGYAYEASAAILVYARQALGLERLVAIASPRNAPSIALLEKLGFQAEGTTISPGESHEVAMFSCGPASNHGLG